MLPEEYERCVLSWLRFVRRMSVPTKEQLAAMNIHPPIVLPLNRFAPDMVFNFDETPVPWEYSDDATYDIKGAKTISINTERSGWDKRQATVILYPGFQLKKHLKAKVIFKGTSPREGGQILRSEGHLYDPRITVEFNERHGIIES